MRFPLMVTEKVRRRLGKDRLLLYRLGADDLAPMGTHVEDAVAFALKLQEVGVDILDVSGGMCNSMPRQLAQVKGYFIPQAERVKKAVKVPVIGVGGITEPAFANQLVAEGKVDLVAVGRALLHDNEWAQKAAQALR
jgi:2,4-dienoyl-CoA reductase-like NADH-dependent reductase (Old Yellow Enzyme family)